MLYGLVAKGQIRSGYTFKINHEKEFMNLDCTKNGNNFLFDIIFMLISIQDMLVEEG